MQDPNYLQLHNPPRLHTGRHTEVFLGAFNNISGASKRMSKMKETKQKISSKRKSKSQPKATICEGPTPVSMSLFFLVTDCWVADIV